MNLRAGRIWLVCICLQRDGSKDAMNGFLFANDYLAVLPYAALAKAACLLDITGNAVSCSTYNSSLGR